jgi:hypothetical protein
MSSILASALSVVGVGGGIAIYRNATEVKRKKTHDVRADLLKHMGTIRNTCDETLLLIRMTLHAAARTIADYDIWQFITEPPDDFIEAVRDLPRIAEILNSPNSACVTRAYESAVDTTNKWRQLYDRLEDWKSKHEDWRLELAEASVEEFDEAAMDKLMGYMVREKDIAERYGNALEECMDATLEIAKEYIAAINKIDGFSPLTWLKYKRKEFS